MKVVVAIDSFKGSLSSLSAGNAVKEAILRVDGNAEVSVCPLADGGEGTVDALFEGLGGELQNITVTGPLGEQVKAKYCILPDRVTAVMEMASAAGITLVPSDKRNPLNTTTFGVGEMIKDAVKKGCRRFIVGIGGSATNDGGVGMLSALGFEFSDENENKIEFGAKGLKNLKIIKNDNVLPEISDCVFLIACDVTNPLCGEKGCSAVFGPQKGADSQMIADMDKWLLNYSNLAKSMSAKADKDYPGVGAAGGLGFAFHTFLNAELQSGVEIVLQETHLEEAIKSADIVVTGEGRLDSQTAMGKAPIGVARLAKKHGKKVIAFAGCVTEDAEVLNGCGIDAFFPILRGVVTLDEALDEENAHKNLEATAYQVFRLLNLKIQ
ncbi:MAG: glycerate kinase [Clostridia bacterium]|nr:glycerate kinase [Clostridia bacterium]